jgi:hypothetical protein
MLVLICLSMIVKDLLRSYCGSVLAGGRHSYLLHALTELRCVEYSWRRHMVTIIGVWKVASCVGSDAWATSLTEQLLDD